MGLYVRLSVMTTRTSEESRPTCTSVSLRQDAGTSGTFAQLYRECYLGLIVQVCSQNGPGSGIREIFGFGQVLLVKSGNLGFRIRNNLKESGNPLTIGIRNPSSTEKGSRLHYLESGIHGLESRIQNFLHSLTWGKVIDLSFIFFYSRQVTIILIFRIRENAGRALRAAVPAILLLSGRPKRI